MTKKAKLFIVDENDQYTDSIKVGVSSPSTAIPIAVSDFRPVAVELEKGESEDEFYITIKAKIIHTTDVGYTCDMQNASVNQK
jgi:hypothetical protein